MKENNNKINFRAKLTDKTKYETRIANAVYCLLCGVYLCFASYLSFHSIILFKFL